MRSPTTAPGGDPAAYRLPTTVRPHAYRLELTPDLGSATFRGDVEIDVSIEEETTTVVLNAAELEITFAELNAGDPDEGYALVPSGIGLDEEEERAVLTFAEPLGVGPATLHLAFTGVLNDMLRGFYRSTFIDEDGVEQVVATTQMESTDARRAFPCFDEPELKATFEVTLVVDEALAAFSNGAVVEDAPEPGGKRRVRFAPTMVMSTYLVAFIVGRLEATRPVDVGGVPLRIVHPPGKGHLTAYALDVGRHALEFFADYFGIPYPADKLDLVAIPDFAFGAMENLGCVTFRESLLLVDPDEAARTELERIADVVCHEVAHMWFGDLVTMKWWNGIWLNEAFATFMEVLAVDAYRPEWERWVSFGVEREAAMAVDGLHATRPVEFPVGRPEEAQGMFDVLTYQKGGSVLRMLEQFLGPEIFRAGIHDYLVTHAYANTETADLWDALERSSGRDVRAIMATFIDQGGYPLVEVGADGSLAQVPFSYRGDPGGAIGSAWQVPVLTRALDGDDRRAALLTEGERVDAAGRLVNAGGSGYYRVAYPTETVERLSADLPALAALERYNLVSDTWAAALAGRAPVADLLRLARAMTASGEGDPSVWSVVLGALGLFDRVVPAGDRPVLAAAVRALLDPLAARLGWDPRPDDDERTPALRASVLARARDHGRARGNRRRGSPQVRGCRDDTAPSRHRVGRPRHRGRRRRRAGLRRRARPLPRAGQSAAGEPLPLRAGLVRRRRARCPGVRAGPRRGPHPERALPPATAPRQPHDRGRELAAGRRCMGHPGREVPLQYPPEDAGGDPGALLAPGARGRGDPVRRVAPAAVRRPYRRPDPRTPRGQRRLRSARGHGARRHAGRDARAPGPLTPRPTSGHRS